MPDAKTVKSLFYQTLRIRMVEEAIASEYSKQEMRCPIHLCIGQEAIPSGVCANLKKSDLVFSYHRSHGHYLGKGGSLKRMIAEFYGKATGCAAGRGGSMHLIDQAVGFCGAIPIVAETIPLAVGTAFASFLKKENVITCVFFGDAAIEEGVLAESLNFASLKKLAVLFVCENNFYSICTHLKTRQPKRDIYQVGKAHRIPSFKEDGNDVLKVYQLAKKAVKHIKAGKGPVFLEFLTYRLKEHCGPYDDPEGCRAKEEVKAWKKKSPLTKLERYIFRKKIISQSEIVKMRKEIDREISQAFEFAKKSPYPDGALSERDVYA